MKGRERELCQAVPAVTVWWPLSFLHWEERNTSPGMNLGLPRTATDYRNSPFLKHCHKFLLNNMTPFQ